MTKKQMESLVAGVKIQSKKDLAVYTIVGIDLEQGKVILDNGKLYTMGTIQRWYSLYEEEIPEVVEPDNTILDDIEQADELTSEQDTTADTDTTTQDTADTEEQTNTSDLKDTDTQDDQLHEQQDTAVKKHIVEPTIQQSNLIQSLNNLIDLHNVRLEPKREYIKVSMEGKRGALCMIRNSRYGSLHIDMKSKVFAQLTEEYRDLLIEQYGCRVYDKSRGYYRIFDCNDIEVLRTIILTAKSIA